MVIILTYLNPNLTWRGTHLNNNKVNHMEIQKIVRMAHWDQQISIDLPN